MCYLASMTVVFGFCALITTFNMPTVLSRVITFVVGLFLMGVGAQVYGFYKCASLR